MNLEDGLHIVEYYENPDSFGWSIKALFCANYRFSGPPRWGTLDALATTDHGSGEAMNVDPDIMEKHEVIRRLWYLVDWHADEAKAREVFNQLKERLW